MTRLSRTVDEARAVVDERRPPRAARLALRLMQQLRCGSLTVRFPDGRAETFGHEAPHATIVLANWNVCSAALRSGDIGFGETFVAGDWSTPDLATLLDVMIANRASIEGVIYGTWWGRALHRLRHVLRRNSRTGSRRNIHAHYDIGNAFYALWLDSSMTYSSALFDDGVPATRMISVGDAAKLDAAQDAKNRRLLAQLALPTGARLLEIGCGWGAFARAAARDGLTVEGVTLSAEQLAWARERTATEGLAGRATFALRDYRELHGRYDGIASIEMFEAVGERYWPGFFATVARCLAPGGRAVIQTITIDDALFEDYRVGSDFIQQHVFPGGMLPSPSAFRAHAERAGLVVVDAFAFGQDYARTLAVWLVRFASQEPTVRAQGFDTRFVRFWTFYLSYCAAAFRSGNIDVIQFTLAQRPC